MTWAAEEKKKGEEDRKPPGGERLKRKGRNGMALVGRIEDQDPVPMLNLS